MPGLYFSMLFLTKLESNWIVHDFFPPPHYNGGNLIWKCAEFSGDKIFFLTFVGGWTSMGGVKTLWGSNIYLISLKTAEHSETWSISFNNFFRECECIGCYLPICSNLLKKSFRKASLFALTVTCVMEKSVL